MQGRMEDEVGFEQLSRRRPVQQLKKKRRKCSMTYSLKQILRMGGGGGGGAAHFKASNMSVKF